MSLVLSELNSAVREIPESKPEPIGVVLLDPYGNWEISRRDGYSVSGNGPIMGLKRNGSWLSNLSFDDSRSVFTSEEHKQNVRGGNWLLYTLNDLLLEWGYSKLTLKQSASFLSTITGRVFDITEGVLVARKTRNPDKKLKDISRSASLATGLMSIMEAAIKKTVPADEKMRSHYEKAYQNGMPHKYEKLNESEISLDFRFPRFTYAMKMAGVRVPLDAEWQKAAKPEASSEDDFIREVISLKRPAIYRAIFEYESDLHPRWLGDLIGHKDGTDRSRFLLEEIIGIPEINKQIESALISKGGDTETIVSGLLKDLAASFGGQEFAALSWTAGLVAENIIAAPHRAGRSVQSLVSGEQVWLAAQDRMLMAPLMRALTEAGCLISSARGGRVTVTAPKVPEVILAAASLAWDHGAYLPLGHANMVQKMFSTDLPTERAAFLGGDSDYLVAAANHKGDRKTLWGLDAICDAKTPKDRRTIAKSFLDM